MTFNEAIGLVVFAAVSFGAVLEIVMRRAINRLDKKIAEEEARRYSP